MNKLKQSVTWCSNWLLNTVKPILNAHSQKYRQIGFQDQLSLNSGQMYCRMLQEEHSAILLTFS